MPIVVAAPPQPVPIFSGFDYVTVDEAHHRVYAAHSSSKRLLIVDATNGRVLGQVDVGPMHGVVVDAKTGMVFTGNGTDQTISKVDPKTMTVARTIKTPELQNNHPLQLDAPHGALFAAGENNAMSAYTIKGDQIAKAAYPGRVDQCDLDREHGVLACFGGGITLFSFDGSKAPTQIAQLDISRGVHTGAIDPKTQRIWTVWSDDKGAHVQAFQYKP